MSSPPDEVLLERASIVADRCADAAAKADSGARDLSLEFSWLRDAGLLTACIPKAEGGWGWGVEGGTWQLLLRLLKIVGRGNLSVGRLYEGHVNAVQLIQQWGTESQKQVAYAEVRKGLLFGVWNTEAPQDGVTVGRIEETRRYVLHGAKTFSSGATVLQRVFANARNADGGWQMCLVPLDEVMVEHETDTWQPIGMRATGSIRVDFTGVQIDEANLLGEAGDYTTEPWFSGGAIRFAAVQLGGAEAIAEEGRRFLQGLSRTDDPYQAMRMGQTAALLESGNLWLGGAAKRADRAEREPEALIAYTGLMRSAIERVCLDVMENTVRSAGARALLRPNALERMVRDLTMYLRQPAPDEVLARAGKYVSATQEHFDTLWRKS